MDKLLENFEQYSDGTYVNKEDSAANCVDIANKHAISFYNWMQDNYYQVSDGFVAHRSTKIITTMESVLKVFYEEFYINEE